jgi:hypothetical protein
VHGVRFLAAKYKLYKKLSKAAANQQITKSRVIESTSALESHNPFSPTKKTRPPPVDPHSPTPTRHVPHFTLETAASETDAQSGHLFRARKRLRGEPVSPSPQKRQRVTSLYNNAFQNSTKNGPGSDNDNDSEGDEEGLPGSSSFVGDSPVKGAQGVRSFKLLFRENGFGPSHIQNGRPSSESKTKDISFSSADNMDVDDVFSDKKPALGPGTVPVQRKSSLATRTKLWKSNLHAAPDKDKTSVLPQDGSSQASGSNLPLSQKQDQDQDLGVDPPSLLPPSPPPSHDTLRPDSNQYKAGGKGKAPARGVNLKSYPSKAAASADMDDGEELRVKIVRRHQAPADDDLDLDTFVQRLGVSDDAESPSDTPLSLFSTDGSHTASPSSSNIPSESTTGATQRQAIAHLLYGRLEGHYHPDKGGEIWDVGELGNGTENDGDDDWEGDPVPWEVGDL